DVVVMPHRRGDDGYFMVQLTPPGAAGDWERPLIPNGEPLHLLVLADTSASMDRTQRATQEVVLASLLAALTPKDTINVAACDVNCDWVFEKPVPATEANVAAVRPAHRPRLPGGPAKRRRRCPADPARAVPARRQGPVRRDRRHRPARQQAGALHGEGVIARC